MMPTMRRPLVLCALSLSSLCMVACDDPDTRDGEAVVAEYREAWGSSDSPSLLDPNFNYTFAQLPTTGKATKTPWAGSYWPTYQDSINMRWAEASAVIHEISASLPTMIFGKGWGATIASPAVGGVTVNFTHCLLTTYWLKTGLVGLFLALLYLFHIGVLLMRLLKVNPVMAVALGGPLAIDVLLYASFKSLDFGLVLLLVPLWAAGAARVASPPRDL